MAGLGPSRGRGHAVLTSPHTLEALERCPLEAWSAARDLAPTDPPDPARGRVGKAAHAVLAWAAQEPRTAEQVQARVSACGLGPSDLEDVARLACAGWRRLPPQDRILGSEVDVEVDLEPDGCLSGRCDLVVRGASGGVEVWDWKSGYDPPDREELLVDPQVLTYWAAAVATYGPDVTLRWVYLDRDVVVTLRPTSGLGLLRSLLRAHARLESRATPPAGRPGAHCATCSWRSGCADRDRWLAAPLGLERFEGAGAVGLGELGSLYRAASARAKVSEQERKDLGARLLAALGEQRSGEDSGVKVSRVRTERQSWAPAAVRSIAVAAGIDPACLWERVGSVRGGALEICLAKLPVEVATELEAERQIGISEHVRVSGELV